MMLYDLFFDKKSLKIAGLNGELGRGNRRFPNRNFPPEPHPNGPKNTGKSVLGATAGVALTW